jgi:hypothetical protein
MSTMAKRSRVLLVGVTLSVAGVAGLPFMAGAVGLESLVGSCSTVGADSARTVCPENAAGTGGGGASHASDPALLTTGSLALAGAAAAGGVALRRRSLRRSSGN